jgi:hypothetical protein
MGLLYRAFAKSVAGCHCERSEAISEQSGDCFGAKSAPRNDKSWAYSLVKRLCKSPGLL